MRKLRVELQREAEADLAGIYGVVLHASQSGEIAEKFVRRIIARCRRVGDAPWGGRPRDDLIEGLRTVPFERSAVIAYRVELDCVRITNIFYGGRDIEAFYLASETDADPTPHH